MDSNRWRSWIAILAGYAASLACYPRLPGPSLAVARAPASVASLVAVTLPTTAAVVLVLLHRLWMRDPIRAHDAALEAVYHAIVFRIVTFIIALHALVLADLSGALGIRRFAGRIVIVLVGVALMSVGNLLPRTRPNIVFGVRTPRLLSDRRRWSDIHRAAGYATVAFGVVLAAAGALLPGALMPAMVVPAGLAFAGMFLVCYRKSADA